MGGSLALQLTAVEPPSDPAIKQAIDVLAAYVARAGSAAEALARVQHTGTFRDTIYIWYHIWSSASVFKIK